MEQRELAFKTFPSFDVLGVNFTFWGCSVQRASQDSGHMGPNHCSPKGEFIVAHGWIERSRKGEGSLGGLDPFSFLPSESPWRVLVEGVLFRRGGAVWIFWFVGGGRNDGEVAQLLGFAFGLKAKLTRKAWALRTKASLE